MLISKKVGDDWEKYLAGDESRLAAVQGNPVPQSPKNTGGENPLYGAFKKIDHFHCGDNDAIYYGKCSEILGNVDYTLKDIENFCGIIKGIGGNRTQIGIYTSAAINKIIREEETVILDLGYVQGLGMHLSKGTVVTEHNVGDYLGSNMTGGTIIVNGDTTRQAGFKMHGGKIIIEGQSENLLGECMDGGEILIKGKAGSNVGMFSSGGRIDIAGDCDSLYRGKGNADIYYKGSLVRKNRYNKGDVILSAIMSGFAIGFIGTYLYNLSMHNLDLGEPAAIGLLLAFIGLGAGCAYPDDRLHIGDWYDG